MNRNIALIFFSVSRTFTGNVRKQVANMPALTSLKLDNNSLTSIEGIADLPKVSYWTWMASYCRLFGYFPPTPDPSPTPAHLLKEAADCSAILRFWRSRTKFMQIPNRPASRFSDLWNLHMFEGQFGIFCTADCWCCSDGENSLKALRSFERNRFCEAAMRILRR